MPDGHGKLCAVCGYKIYKAWIYHARLGAYLHATCPMTDVFGEDITNHAVYVGKLM